MTYHEHLVQAMEHLRVHDPALARAIDHHGLPELRPHNDYYRSLVSSIISQQLSTKAAASILSRFSAAFEPPFPDPVTLLATSDETLRSLGLSRAKIGYIKDLSLQITDGRIVLTDLGSLPDEATITQLTQVKGIGTWTVHMFLIFCMGRLDVLAHGDLGIRNGMRKLYQLDNLPTPAEVEQLASAHHWSPYRSIACWYVWRSLEMP